MKTEEAFGRVFRNKDVICTSLPFVISQQNDCLLIDTEGGGSMMCINLHRDWECEVRPELPKIPSHWIISRLKQHNPVLASLIADYEILGTNELKVYLLGGTGFHVRYDSKQGKIIYPVTLSSDGRLKELLTKIRRG